MKHFNFYNFKRTGGEEKSLVFNDRKDEIPLSSKGKCICHGPCGTGETMTFPLETAPDVEFFSPFGCDMDEDALERYKKMNTPEGKSR